MEDDKLSDKLGGEKGSSIPSLRPTFEKKFNKKEVSAIIREIFEKRLEKAEYDSEKVAQMTKELANEIRDTVTAKKYERYRLVVNLTIGEQKGQGIKMGCRCLWDEDTDNFVKEMYINNSIFAVAIVFGIYKY